MLNNLTPQEIEALLDAAEETCRAYSPRKRQGSLSWNGREFLIRKSILRIFVNLPDGTPLASRLKARLPVHERA